MNVTALIQRIQSRPDYAGQLEHLEVLPERPGRFAAPDEPLAGPLRRLLASRGIEQLYCHQVAALEAARDGRDLVVVTGTASGKTLCYNLPILESAIATGARALYLFPTKALAQDQLKGLLELVADDPELARAIRPGVYDGDTPTAQRRRIRGEASLVLSNPDMLHASVLPYHPKWAAFFSDLRYIVIDEIHTYRGILGAHVSAVLRRLMRICDHYGSTPVFLAASATIANPGELTSRLIGRDVEVIDDDGSPRGANISRSGTPLRSATIRSPAAVPTTMPSHGSSRPSKPAARRSHSLRTRQSAELIHRYAREHLVENHSPLADKVRAYRGGYLPNERRQIEQDLFNGNLRGVAATNSLELGIDIGTLDVALLVNYPGTIASSWQQAGRSGRRHDESLAVLLAGNDPVDQYLLRHPEYFFAQSPEHAVVDPNNPYVLAKHLPAAAFELPLRTDGPSSDLERFGPLAAPLAGVLRDQGTIVDVKQQYYFAGGQNPAVGVSLRHMSDNTFSIVERDGATSKASTDNKVIANVDAISAPELVYPEAIYLHNGETYLVRELDLLGKIAYVERRETDYYTQAVLESNVRITGQRDTSPAVPQTTLAYGDADVAWQTVAFKKIKFTTRENIGLGPVDIPAQNLQTTALWLAPDDAIRQEMKAGGLRASEGVVGMRNLAMVALPLVAMCDSRDLGGVVDSQNLGRTTMILYDRYPGGLGYCERGFAQMPQVLAICLEMVRDCTCDDGCPSCIGLPNLRPAIHSDPDLTRGHPMPNKLATIRLLELLCDPAELLSIANELDRAEQPDSPRLHRG